MEQSLQTVKEEEWAKQVRLQNEKVELEEKLTELQRYMAQPHWISHAHSSQV